MHAFRRSDDSAERFRVNLVAEFDRATHVPSIGRLMTNKAPQRTNSKKPAAKSLKEKRLEKKSKKDGTDRGLGI